jgi:peptidoglycan/LPS O-acetylase OafA/YrhL
VKLSAGRAGRPAATARAADAGTRLDGIDALPGLAIFFVLMNHVNMRLFIAKMPYSAALPDQLIASLMWSGQYGVQMFFAVSGFLITRNALTRWDTPAKLEVREPAASPAPRFSVNSSPASTPNP